MMFHDADPADEKRDADDTRDGGGDSAQDLIDRTEYLVLDEDPEVVRLALRDAMPLPENPRDPVPDGVDVVRGLGLKPELDLLAGPAAEEVQRGLERDEDEVVVVLPEKPARALP